MSISSSGVFRLIILAVAFYENTYAGFFNFLEESEKQNSPSTGVEVLKQDNKNLQVSVFLGKTRVLERSLPKNGSKTMIEEDVSKKLIEVFKKNSKYISQRPEDRAKLDRVMNEFRAAKALFRYEDGFWSLFLSYGSGSYRKVATFDKTGTVFVENIFDCAAVKAPQIFISPRNTGNYDSAFYFEGTTICDLSKQIDYTAVYNNHLKVFDNLFSSVDYLINLDLLEKISLPPVTLEGGYGYYNDSWMNMLSDPKTQQKILQNFKKFCRSRGGKTCQNVKLEVGGSEYSGNPVRRHVELGGHLPKYVNVGDDSKRIAVAKDVKNQTLKIQSLVGTARIDKLTSAGSNVKVEVTAKGLGSVKLAEEYRNKRNITLKEKDLGTIEYFEPSKKNEKNYFYQVQEEPPLNETDQKRLIQIIEEAGGNSNNSTNVGSGTTYIRKKFGDLPKKIKQIKEEISKYPADRRVNEKAFYEKLEIFKAFIENKRHELENALGPTLLGISPRIGRFLMSHYHSELDSWANKVFEDLIKQEKERRTAVEDDFAASFYGNRLKSICKNSKTQPKYFHYNFLEHKLVNEKAENDPTVIDIACYDGDHNSSYYSKISDFFDLMKLICNIYGYGNAGLLKGVVLNQKETDPTIRTLYLRSFLRFLSCVDGLRLQKEALGISGKPQAETYVSNFLDLLKKVVKNYSGSPVNPDAGIIEEIDRRLSSSDENKDDLQRVNEVVGKWRGNDKGNRNYVNPILNYLFEKWYENCSIYEEKHGNSKYFSECFSAINRSDLLDENNSRLGTGDALLIAQLHVNKLNLVILDESNGANTVSFELPDARGTIYLLKKSNTYDSLTLLFTKEQVEYIKNQEG